MGQTNPSLAKDTKLLFKMLDNMSNCFEGVQNCLSSDILPDNVMGTATNMSANMLADLR